MKRTPARAPVSTLTKALTDPAARTVRVTPQEVAVEPSEDSATAKSSADKASKPKPDVTTSPAAKAAREPAEAKEPRSGTSSAAAARSRAIPQAEAEAAEGLQLPAVTTEPKSSAAPGRTEPNQTKPNQTKPNQTKPNQTKPNQTEPTSGAASKPRLADWTMPGLILPTQQLPGGAATNTAPAFRRALMASLEARPTAPQPDAASLQQWAATLEKAAQVAPDHSTAAHLRTVSRYVAGLSHVPVAGRSKAQRSNPYTIRTAQDLRATLPARFGVDLLG